MTAPKSHTRIKVADVVSDTPHYEVRAWPTHVLLSTHYGLFSTAPLCAAARLFDTRVVAVRISDGKSLGVAEKPRKEKSLNLAYNEVLAEQERETNAALGRSYYSDVVPAMDEDEEEEEDDVEERWTA